MAAPGVARVYADGIGWNGLIEDADDYAQRALGLSFRAAHHLFYCSTNAQAVARLRWYAEHPEEKEMPASVVGEIGLR